MDSVCTSISCTGISMFNFEGITGFNAYHFESVKLLLDLLCKHRSEPVAGSDLSSSIILRARPGIVELDARTEGDVPRK